MKDAIASFTKTLTDTAPNVKSFVSFKILGIILLTKKQASFHFSFESDYNFCVTAER